MSSTDACDLRDRFLVQQEEARRYLDVLGSRLGAFRSRCRDVVHLLQQHGVAQAAHIEIDWLPEETLGNEQLSGLADALSALRPDLQRLYERTREAINDAGRPIEPSELVDRSYFRECVQYFREALDPADLTNVRPGSLEALKQQIEENNQEYACDDGHNPLDPDTTARDALAHAQFELRIRTLVHVDVALATVDELSFIAETTSPGAWLSAWRQAFIVLVAAFDATVFDLVREALHRDFFGVITRLSRGGKLKLGELDQVCSWQEVQEDLIERELKLLYLKDLLVILDAGCGGLTDTSAGDTLGHLVEVVNRRNCHMHNQGIVDERYLGGKDEEKSEFNVYRLSVGDVAHIDEAYWDTANRLCANAVTRIAAWVDSL